MKARIRTRESAVPVTVPEDCLITYQDLQHSHMFIVYSMEELELLASSDEVLDAYVKVQITLRASERAGFDSNGLRAKLLTAGAAAVTMAPVIVPDGKRAAEATQSSQLSPEAHLKEWFAGTKNTKSVIAAALAEALESVRGAGL